jgi:hypothetical protein
VATYLWYLLSVAALLGLPREIERLSGIAPKAQWPAWIVLMPVILNNLGLGQSGPVLLWLATAGVARTRLGRAAMGGALLMLGALLKLLPAVLLGIPLLFGRLRGALAGALLATAGVVAAGCLLVGPAEMLAGTRRWIDYTSEGQTHLSLVVNGDTLRYNNQSLAITLARTFGDVDRTKAKGLVQLSTLPLEHVIAFATGLMAAFAALGLAAALAARRTATPRAWLALLGMACIALLIPSPIVWTHYFIWMLPALVAVAHRRRLMWIGGTIFVAGLAVQPARALGLHMACALGLYVLLAVELIRAALAVTAPRAAGPPAVGSGAGGR